MTMANSRVLLDGLKEYRHALEQHLSHLRSEYQQLDNRWRQFSVVYEGNAAEQFRNGWVRTSQRFQLYIDETQKISAMLDERISYLEAIDKEEGGLIG
jgi:hypothetical protein